MVLFIAAIFFFYGTIDEHSYVDEVMTVESSEAGLPIISFLVNGNEINQTKGYSAMQEENHPRESITPVSTAQTFGIYIKEKNSEVKLADVDVLDLPNLNKVSHFTANSMTKTEDGRLYLEVTVEDRLAENVEYLLRVTLTTSTGDKVYYYTRLLVATFGNLTESVGFVNNFHSSTFDKNKVYELDGVMESDDDKVITDYSHIDITADMETLSYGSMQPTELYRYVPQITEYNENYVSATIVYWIEAFTTEGLESYRCKEDFRFQYSSYRTYLFNFDRTMESVFKGNHFTIGDSEMKLGITDNPEIDKIYSSNGEHMLFAYQGILWHLNMSDNTLTKVLSFGDEDYDRVGKIEHGFELLSIDENGNAEFAVYGYIGKGVYEGRMGIIYYYYHSDEQRIEEKIFIPVSVEFDELEGEFGKVSYTSKFDVFYFTLFDGFYSYELETNVLKTIVEDMGDNWVYFEDEQILCYNETSNVTENQRIVIYDVENGETSHIVAKKDRVVTLLGTVDGRIVYGNGVAKYVSFYADGSEMLPLTDVVIAELDGLTVESYKPAEGVYVGEVEFNPGIIDLSLYTLESEADGENLTTLKYVEKDVIINLNQEATKPISYTSRVNEITGKEYYITLPTGYTPSKNPDKKETVATVIKTDTSAIINRDKYSEYHVIAYGEIVMSTDSLGEAIGYADATFSTVIDKDGNVRWKRGVMDEKASLGNTEVSHINSERNAWQAAMQMLFNYEGVAIDATTLNLKQKPMYMWLKEYIGDSVAMVEGATLEQLMYFVSEGKPILAPIEDYYVMVIGYSEENVYYLDPITGEKKAKSKESAEQNFKAAGGIYYVY